MARITSLPDGRVLFSVDDVKRGFWSWGSPASTPEGFATTFQNMYLPGGIPTSLPGDGVFEDVAYDAASTVTLACDYKPTVGGSPVQIIGTSLGKIIKVTGAAATVLRTNFSTAAGIWWAHQQYGSDLFITNPTDGIWRYDNDTLVPIGAKPIAQFESDEAALWSGETADTTNYREGLQSMYVESSGAQTTMTFTPAANVDAVTGRVSARDYAVDKSPGTDFYHFKVMFSNTGTIDTTNTRVLLTDGSAVTLNFPYTTWDSDRSGTALANPPVAGTWYDVYLPALDGTDSGTFNAANIDTFAFAVDTSAGTLRMNVDDFYVQYAATMPACQFLAEWKNILFGFVSDDYHFSEVGAPDEYDTDATASFKSDGESITGVKRFFNQLTIGTENHIFTMSGDPQGQAYPDFSFNISEVTDEVGISSHRSIVKIQNSLVWLWKNAFYRYNGTGVTKISYALDSYLSTLDPNAAQFVVGAPNYTNNHAWWTWRRSGQSVNDRAFIYDLTHEAFFTVSGLTTPVFYRTTSSNAERLISADESSRKLYRQYHASNLTFVGSNIDYALELPPMHISGTSCEWFLAWLEWLSNTGTMLVEFRQGDTLLSLVADSYETAETVTMTAVGEYGDNRIGERSSWLQLRFSSTATKMELQPPFLVVARPQDLAFIRTTP